MHVFLIYGCNMYDHLSDVIPTISYISLLRSILQSKLINYFMNMFIFVANMCCFFSGICLNSLVIVSFWKSWQLRKKTCHFMILVLSCFDLLALLTNNPLTALITMLWLTGKLNVWPSWADISLNQPNLSFGFSLLALLVLNFDRYLAASYRIFHRTSVTKGRLLTLLAILITFEITLGVIYVNDFLLSYRNGIQFSALAKIKST